MLRFGTHSENEPIHRLAARDGFRRTATYQRYRADSHPADDAPPLRKLAKVDLPAAWALVSKSPRYRASSGLYEDLWIWKRLTRERLAHHLAAGDVWGTGEQGELTALALVHRTEEALNVGLVDGRDDALVAILQGLQGLTAQLGCAELRIKPVDESALMSAVEATGYERHRDKEVWIFELQLSPSGVVQK